MPSLFTCIKSTDSMIDCICARRPLTAFVWKYPTLLSLYVYELMGKSCLTQMALMNYYSKEEQKNRNKYKNNG